MKEVEIIEDQNSMNRIYDLEIIQNKYVGIGFDPEIMSISSLYRTEAVFHDIFAYEDTGTLISGAKVDGTDLRSYMKDLLQKKNMEVPYEKDFDRYCMAFILFGMTEKNPVVTVERDGKTEPVYELPGLDHENDTGTVLSFPIPNDHKNDLEYKGFVNTDSLRVKQILRDAGADPANEEEVRSLFVTWYVSEYGKSFEGLGRLNGLTEVQKIHAKQ